MKSHPANSIGQLKILDVFNPPCCGNDGTARCPPLSGDKGMEKLELADVT